MARLWPARPGFATRPGIDVGQRYQLLAAGEFDKNRTGRPVRETGQALQFG